LKNSLENDNILAMLMLYPVREGEVRMMGRQNAAQEQLFYSFQRFAMKPQRLVGDAAYGAAAMLNWLVHERQIEPHVPVLDKTQRDDGTLSCADFIFDEQHDRYICPSGKYLHTTGRTTVDDTRLYRSKNLECASCPLKSQCCPNTPNRKIARSIYETARDHAEP
jgi:hypothetical protein